MLSGGQVAMTSKKRSRTQAAKKEANQNTEPIKVSVYQSFLSSRFAFATLIGGVIVLRLVLFYTSYNDPYLQFRVGDEAHYHEWALKILNGQWARGTSFFTTPLYAYFLAIVYFVGGHGMVYVRFLNVLMGIGTVLMTYLTARNYLSRNASLLATILLGFCTAPIFYEWFPEKTSLVLFITAISFYLISRASLINKPMAWLISGLSVGLASSGHMLLLVIVPAIWVYLVLNRRDAAMLAIKSIAIFTLGFFLGVSPATIHNYLQDKEFILVSSNGGQNFYVSNHAGNFTGEYISPPFSVANIEKEEANFKQEAERRTQHAMKPSEVSRFWFQQGWIEMQQEPELALTRFWNRLRWAAGADEPSDTRTYEFYKARYRILNPPFWGFGVVSCLGLVGLLLTLRNRKYLPLTLFVVFFIAGISVFFVYGRYRLPLLIPLSILATVALGQAYEWAKQRRWTALVVLGLAAGAVALVLRGPVLPSNLEVSFFPDYYNQGNKYWNIGAYELATAEYEKALSVRPGDHPGVESLYRFLAGVYLKSGQLSRAQTLLQKAAMRYPRNQEFQEKLQMMRTLKQQPTAEPQSTTPKNPAQ